MDSVQIGELTITSADSRDYLLKPLLFEVDFRIPPAGLCSSDEVGVSRKKLHQRIEDAVASCGVASPLDRMKTVLRVLECILREKGNSASEIEECRKKWLGRECIVQGVVGQSLLNLDDGRASRLWDKLTDCQATSHELLHLVEIEWDPKDQFALYPDLPLMGGTRFILGEFKVGARVAPRQFVNYLRLYDSLRNRFEVSLLVIAPTESLRVFEKQAAWVRKTALGNVYTADYRGCKTADPQMAQRRWAQDQDEGRLQALCDAFPIRVISYSHISRALAEMAAESSDVPGSGMQQAIDALEFVVQENEFPSTVS